MDNNEENNQLNTENGTPQNGEYHYTAGELNSDSAENDYMNNDVQTAPEQRSGADPQPAQPVYAYQYAEPAPQKPKKEIKVTRGGIALLVIACVLISTCFGLGGAYLGVRFLKNSGSGVGTTVLYQSVKDENAAQNSSGYTVAEVAAAVSDSVVEIVTESVTIDNSWVQDYVVSGAGSGVIISTDGYIITNNHVVSGSSHYKVTLHNGKEYDATLIGTDADNDIAVIKIDATGLTAAVWGDSESLIVGQPVVAIGNPLGSLGGTVTDGVISALNRTVTVENLSMELIQTNAAVNPGNSGGGLFDTKGNLIGIVNAKSSDDSTEGLGFAIPEKTAKQSAVTIIEKGSVDSDRPALGVTVLNITDQTLATKYGVSRLGVYVGKVNSGSPADKAGLKSGDYIMSIDGKVVSTNDDLTTYLATCKIGQKVELQIIRVENREERMMKVEVSLEKFNASSY